MHSASTARPGIDTRILFDRLPLPSYSPGPLDHMGRLVQIQDRVQFFWAMTPIALKYVGRGQTDRAITQLYLLLGAFVGAWRLVHDPARREGGGAHWLHPVHDANLRERVPRLGEVIDPASVLAAITGLMASMRDLHPAAAALGVSLPTDAVAEIERLRVDIEARLATAPRAGQSTRGESSMPDAPIDPVDAAIRDAATDWFEPLYAAAARGKGGIPWDRGGSHPLLLRWTDRRKPDGAGKRAVVVGCGTGDDAALVASRGYATTGFDISPSAIAAARARYPDGNVDFRVTDLFELPEEWLGAFDLVVESQTVQALPRALRTETTVQVASLVAPGGTLLVLAVAAPGDLPLADGPPWPLTRAEVEAFTGHGLDPVTIELVPDAVDPAFHRWSAEFHRVADG